MDKKGVITVKVLILIISILLVFSVLFTGLYKHSFYNHTVRNEKVVVDNNLSDYSTYLYVNYGLYGTKSKLSGKFKHSIYKKEEYEVELLDPISDTTVFNHQIQEFMKIRAPVNIMDRVLKKLDIIKKAKDTKKILGLKEEVDILLSDVSKLYDQRIHLSERVNNISYLYLDAIVSDVKDIKEKKEELFIVYDQLKKEKEVLRNLIDHKEDIKEKLKLMKDLAKLKDDIYEVKKEIKDIITLYKEVQSKLENIKNINGKLLENLIAFYQSSKEVSAAIDRVLPIVKSDKKAIEAIRNFTISELTELKTKISSSDLYLIYDVDNVKEYLKKRGIEIEDKFLPILKTPFHNIKMIENILGDIKYSSAHSNLWDFPQIEILYSYHYTRTDEVVSGDKKYLTYYKQMKSEEDKSYIPKDVYEKKDIKFIYNTSSIPHFWNINSLKLVKESIYINEYILSTFQSYCKKENENSDYFDKKKRHSFYKEGEIEYILMGEKYEIHNITKTVAAIFTIRTAMNTIHVYSDPEKMMLSETIGASVAGITGFGAVIVSNAIRVIWAMGESAIDVKDLIKGKDVPFYKFTPEQWKLDLGIVYPKKEMPEYIELIFFDYYDYVYFMLLTLDNETKLRRMINLIQANIKEEGILLNEYFTTVKYGKYQRSYYE